MALRNFKKYTSDKRGQLLLEILVATAVVAVIGSLVSQMVIVGAYTNKWSSEHNAALGLIETVFEAADSVAFARWQNIYNLNKTSSDHYYPLKQSGAWAVAAGEETVSLNGINYSRYFTVENVCRDNTSRAIITTSGVPPCTAGNSDDPSTQKITAYASWPNGSLSRSFYLTRWRNKICSQTAWSTTGSGTTTCPATYYENATSIDNTSAPGSLKIQAN